MANEQSKDFITIGQIREYFAKKNNADFTDPITVGVFVSIVAWESEQPDTEKTQDIM